MADEVEAGVERAVAVREVARRVAPVPGLDSAYAHCLGCGRHAGGREDAGFTSRGTQARVEERARAHTAETGHPTRMYGGREQVTEFYIGSREEGPCDDC
jgi:hypothetical protein